MASARDVTATFVVHRSDRRRLGKVVDRIDAGTEILVDRVVSLDSLAEAFADQEAGHARGKILLTI